MGRPQGNQPLRSTKPLKPLKIVPQYDSAHAKADEIESLIGRKLPFNKRLYLTGQLFQRHSAIARLEGHRVDTETLFNQMADQLMEDNGIVSIARDEHYRPISFASV